MSKKTVRKRSRKTGAKRAAVGGGKSVSFGSLKKAMGQLTKEMNAAVKSNPSAEGHVSEILTAYDDLLNAIGCEQVMTIKF